MNQQELENYVAGLPNVQRQEAFGYVFFSLDGDDRLPFVTFANRDQDFDKVSHLDRPGVFRINIGLARETFDALVGGSGDSQVDYSKLDTFLPHPEYAKQNFVCILNPTAERLERTKALILEAHAIAVSRMKRQGRYQH